MPSIFRERVDGANDVRLELSIYVRRASGIQVDGLEDQLSGQCVVTTPAQEDGGVRLDEHEPIGSRLSMSDRS